MNYLEAVSSAIKEPGIDFVGTFIKKNENYAGFYAISTNTDEPGQVNIWYEGGDLFSDWGEEEIYFPKNVPEEAKKIKYTKKPKEISILGSTSEHMLYMLIPDLQNPCNITTEAEMLDFVRQVRESVSSGKLSEIA